jgi:hypothetical protein
MTHVSSVLDLGYKIKMDPNSNDIRELWKGESLELLKALHILTRDGKLNADSRRKLKQVYHLAQFIEPMITKIQASNPDFKIVDMGAGKSYLGFILYDLVLRPLAAGKMISIESRPELVAQSKTLATASHFDRMDFVSATIEQVTNGQVTSPLLASGVDLVCALHACDTATDDAIQFGIKHQAKAFALVPCCQAEVARLLDESKSKVSDEAVKNLFSQPLHRREFGSHLTNVIRVLLLQSLGYKVTVTELIGWEHSMKNELILAEKISGPDHPQSRKAKASLMELLARFQITPKLVQTIETI